MLTFSRGVVKAANCWFLITFQDRVHCASVKRILHATDKKLLGPFRQIINDQLVMNRDRLHHLVNHFTVDFCTHNVDLWPVRFSESQESHPIAVSHFATEGVGDLVVQAEAMSNLEVQEKYLLVKNESKFLGLNYWRFLEDFLKICRKF